MEGYTSVNAAQKHDLKVAACLAVFLIVTLLALAWCSRADGATPTPFPTITPFDASKVDYSKFNEQEIADTEAHRDQLKATVREAQDKQAAVIQDQGSTLQDVKAAGVFVQKSFNDYVQATEALATKANQAIAAYDHEHKKHKRAQWVLCGVWLGCVALVVMKLPPAAKMYGLYIGGGLAAAGLLAIWTIL